MILAPIQNPGSATDGKPSLFEPERLIAAREQAIDAGAQRRIELTVACHDCHEIPKVPGAGDVFPYAGTTVQRMHNGVMVLAGGYHGSWMMEIIKRLKGHHEPQEEKAFHAVMGTLGNAEMIVELGAFWSYYSLWFLQEFPNAQAVLVEPDPYNLEIGQKNFQLNNRVGTFFQAAVDGQSSDPLPFDCESDGQSRPISRLSVDDLVSELEASRIDVLFADIQGAETAMLNGIQETVKKGIIRYVFLSTHHHDISQDYRTHEKCLKKLQELGAQIVVDHTVEESFSGDGLIVASFEADKRVDIQLSHCRHRDSLFGSSEQRIAEIADSVRRLQQELAEKEQQLTAAALFHSGVQSAPALEVTQLETSRKAIGNQLKQSHRQSRSRLPRASRELRGLVRDWRLDKMAIKRASALRSSNRTEVVVGLHGVFELLTEDKVITPAIRRDLHWDIEAQRRALRLVESHAGMSLKGATILDIGANIGMVGIQMVFSGLMRRCIAIEPHPDNFALLHSNTQINGVGSSFHFGWCALGSRNGNCEMEESAENWGDHRVRLGSHPIRDERYQESGRNVIQVPMRRFDDLLEQCPGDFKNKIALCWIDVQGFEGHVLEGGMASFSTCGWPSVLEFWPYGLKRAGYDPTMLVRLLSQIWGKCLVLEEPDDMAWRDFESLHSLWDELGTEGAYVNILQGLGASFGGDWLN